MTFRFLSSASLATFMMACVSASCQPQAVATENPIEVGAVHWSRDLDAALASSKESGKPIFLLFQEVPGCSGCKDFGKAVLSDPEIVGKIERNFIPVLIHNNKGGKDEVIRKRFKEPAWNYQVVRFIDGNGEDLIPRKDHIWTSAALNTRMKAALEKAGREDVSNKQVAFSQSCFWTGEMKLGAMNGVIRTEAGFLDGHEVTLVDYDPSVLALEDLIRTAIKQEVADGIYLSDESQNQAAKKAGISRLGKIGPRYRKAPPSDQKRQLTGTQFARLKLTPEQATKVNAFARSNPTKAAEFLTAGQRKQVE